MVQRHFAHTEYLPSEILTQGWFSHVLTQWGERQIGDTILALVWSPGPVGVYLFIYKHRWLARAVEGYHEGCMLGWLVIII